MVEARPTASTNWDSQWRTLGKCLGMTKKHKPKSILVNIRKTSGMMIVIPSKTSSNSLNKRTKSVPDRAVLTGTCKFSWELDYNSKRQPKFLTVAKCKGKQCKTCHPIFYTHQVLIMKPNCSGVWEWKKERHAIAYVQRSI